MNPTDPGIVLVASPFTGPFAWSKVAAVLKDRGWRVSVDGNDDHLAAPVVLVGHSGAGPRVPARAASMVGVVGMILVDSPLPHPGKSWAQTAPPQLLDHLRAIVRDGRLPPWPQWWPESAMQAILPDDDMRAQFAADCPTVPFSVLDEVTPVVAEPPAGYILLSEISAPDADEAARRGWPVERIDGTHLSILTDPERVVDAIGAVIAALASA